MDRTTMQQALATAQARAAAGDFDAARAICAAIFAHDPGVVGALQTYMSVTRVGVDDPVLARLRLYAVQKGLADGLRAQMLFMLGKGLDDIGDLAGAFDAFVAANALKPRQFDSAAQERIVAGLIAAAAGLGMATLPPAGPRMVFVIGMPRSGTSLVSQMLGAHPQIAALGEQTALGRAAAAIERRPVRLVRALTAAQAEAIRAAYLVEVVPLGRGAPVLVDKMPENYWFGWLIPQAFPDAVILNMTRPPLATCWSCFRNDFGQGHAYSSDFPTLWQHYHRYARMAAAWRGMASGRWHDLALGDLVADPQAALAPVLAALGLDWQPAMARPDRAGGQVATLSKWQARQALDPAIAGGWQAYRAMILARWGADLDPPAD